MGVSLVSDANAKKCCLVQDILLEDVVGGIYPQRLQPRTFGVSAMLAAAEATPGVMKIDVHTPKAKPTSSSRTKWEIRYKAKRCLTPRTPAECTDPCGDVAADINEWLYAQPTMGTALYEAFTIDLADYRSICEGSQDFLNEQLYEVYESLKIQANQRYIDQLLAAMGNYYSPSDADCSEAVSSASDPRTISVLDATGAPQPRGLYQIMQQYRRMGINSTPLVVGGTHFDAMAWQTPVYNGLINDAVQVERNMARFSNLPQIFVDYDIDATYAAGDPADLNPHAWSIVPGAAHRLFWNQFDGENAYASERLVKRKFDLGALFGDPGFVVDQSIYVDECGDCDVRILYKFHLSTDLFILPSDLFNATTCGQCSNYLLNWLVECGTLDCSNFTTL